MIGYDGWPVTVPDLGVIVRSNSVRATPRTEGIAVEDDVSVIHSTWRTLLHITQCTVQSASHSAHTHTCACYSFPAPAATVAARTNEHGAPAETRMTCR